MKERCLFTDLKMSYSAYLHSGISNMNTMNEKMAKHPETFHFRDKVIGIPSLHFGMTRVLNALLPVDVLIHDINLVQQNTLLCEF